MRVLRFYSFLIKICYLSIALIDRLENAVLEKAKDVELEDNLRYRHESEESLHPT